MKESFSFTDLITALIAIYGAVLSTIIFIREYQKTKRKIRLGLKVGYLTYDQGVSPSMLLFEIINPGLKNVTINAPQIQTKDGKNFIMPKPNSNVKFPYELPEGKNAHVWMDIEVFKTILLDSGYSDSVKIKAVLFDQTGRKFYSKGWLRIKLIK